MRYWVCTSLSPTRLGAETFFFLQIVLPVLGSLSGMSCILDREQSFYCLIPSARTARPLHQPLPLPSDLSLKRSVFSSLTIKASSSYRCQKMSKVSEEVWGVIQQGVVRSAAN